jgi:hypothetical protein
MDSIRTLFIGEDTSRRNNNYVWAFNIDTRKLSRILSVPMNGEATGLTVAPNQQARVHPEQFPAPWRGRHPVQLPVGRPG